jgi:hypothetical protein
MILTKFRLIKAIAEQRRFLAIKTIETAEPIIQFIKFNLK